MPTRRPSLSFVLPVYNGARFLDGSLRAAWAWLEAGGREGELLVVDDGSTDATPRILAAFAAEHSDRQGLRFSVLRNPENRGKGFALRRAFLAATGELVVFTDADLTYPMANADTVVAALEAGADLAYGSRMHADSRYVVAPSFFVKLYTRHLMGRLFNLLVRLCVVPGVRDTQAGLKGFRRVAARDLASRLHLARFSFDVELFFVARRLSLRLAECPVEFLYCKEPSTVQFVRDSLRMVRDMAVIRWRGLRGLYDRPGDATALAILAQDAPPGADR